MAASGWKIHRPRQVIVVALVTSLFWFVLNTLILYTYQGRSAEEMDRRLIRNIQRHENEFNLDEVVKNKDKSFLPRGNTKLKFNSHDRANIDDNLAGGDRKSMLKNFDTNIAREVSNRNNFENNQNIKTGVWKRRKPPKVILKTQQISSQKQKAPGKIYTEKQKPGKELHKTTETADESANTPVRDLNGPGEHGRAVTIGSDEKAAEKEGYDKHAFNELASKKISLHRSIPDTRNSGCRSKIYPEKLPTASVVICFHNEAWSTLLRTVHSVLDRSPARLLEEIILIDDFSSYDHLKKPLEDYVAKLGKVRIIRTTKREGLIRARLLGADVAKADVITFLDAHCEANEQWLEPLLERIKVDRTIVAVPVIDIIGASDFAYSGTPAEVIGGFSWDMQFSWHSLPAKRRADRKDLTEPIRTPTMAGGLFSIDRKYFFESGSYDEGMDVWGGENLEMSFRIWQCGGKLEIIPCSRVGHVFRSRFPYKFPGGYNEVSVNLARVVRVWMDNYDQYVYMKRPDLRRLKYGNITSRSELRNRLQCKSFKWYLDNVYPEQSLPGGKFKSFGEIHNPETRLCLDTMGRTFGDLLGSSLCHGQGGNQQFFLTNNGQLKVGNSEMCIDAQKTNEVALFPCDVNAGIWSVDKDTLYHKQKKRCLELSQGKLLLKECKGKALRSQEFVIKNPS